METASYFIDGFAVFVTITFVIMVIIEFTRTEGEEDVECTQETID